MRSPSSSTNGPSAIVPSRSFGPWRSASTAIGRPVPASISRTISRRSRWSSWLPWLKLKRKTSVPASNKAWMTSRLELAGPSVATILA